MKIRAARLQDCEAIADVHVKAWRESYRGLVPDAVLDTLSVSERTEMWRQILGGGSTYKPIFIAEQEDGVVGFAGGGFCRSAVLSQDMEIYAIYLLDRVKRQGIGGKLLQTLLSDFRLQGALSAGLWVIQGNHPARSFYENFGAHCTTEKLEHRPGYDLVEVGYVWLDINVITSH